MILVVDIGNTNINFGIYDGDRLIGSWRMVTKSDKTSDEYGIFILSALANSNIDHRNIIGGIVSSVVPNLMYSFQNAMKKYFNIDPLIVGPGIKTGITVTNENPKQVGADRIVDLVAAYEIYGGPSIVIDFGTATTYDVVSEKGEFKYGLTSPGIQICADALWQRTAQLPSIEIRKPESILAKNTITSMQAGLVYGYIGQVEYIVKKLKEGLKREDMKVIATGGLGRLMADSTSMIDVYDPMLLFKGLKIIYDKNVKENI
jgi:type III pantothenate kinase